MKIKTIFILVILLIFIFYLFGTSKKSTDPAATRKLPLNEDAQSSRVDIYEIASSEGRFRRLYEEDIKTNQEKLKSFLSHKSVSNEYDQYLERLKDTNYVESRLMKIANQNRR